MALALPLVLLACPSPREPGRVAPRPPPERPAAPTGPVEFEPKWRGMSQAAYLLPTERLVGDDGRFDAVFFFHAGQAAEKEIRAVGLNAAFVAATLGMGSIPYNDAFQDPERFGRMIAELERNVSQLSGKQARVRRVAIIAWSAGFGAPQKILAQKYDEKIDAVFLLDGLHAGYKEPVSAKRADPRFISMFIKFARAAIEGHKLMVITHSSVQTPDYATSKETTAALLETVGVQPQARDTDWNGMHMILEAHAGNLHVRGFSGGEKRDHVNHLHVVDELMTEYLAPRWSQPR
jgi:hypothetical protein